MLATVLSCYPVRFSLSASLCFSLLSSLTHSLSVSVSLTLSLTCCCRYPFSHAEDPCRMACDCMEVDCLCVS